MQSHGKNYRRKGTDIDRLPGVLAFLIPATVRGSTNCSGSYSVPYPAYHWWRMLARHPASVAASSSTVWWHKLTSLPMAAKCLSLWYTDHKSAPKPWFVLQVTDSNFLPHFVVPPPLLCGPTVLRVCFYWFHRGLLLKNERRWKETLIFMSSVTCMF